MNDVQAALPIFMSKPFALENNFAFIAGKAEPAVGRPETEPIIMCIDQPPI